MAKTNDLVVDERHQELLDAYSAAQAAVREQPDDADVAATYRAAKDAFAAHRSDARQGTGIGFGADMIRTEG